MSGTGPEATGVGSYPARTTSVPNEVSIKKAHIAQHAAEFPQDHAHPLAGHSRDHGKSASQAHEERTGGTEPAGY